LTGEERRPTAAIPEVTDTSFDADVLASERPVLVDFWAPWCGPCRVMDPVIEELAERHGDRISFARMDVDDNPETAARFDILSMPTLLVFEAGEVRRRLIGARPRRKLEEELAAWLGGAA
jgi:thioredoxin 1